jgi:hypothetical protein
MKAFELYKELIEKISVFLKKEAFSKKGNSFYFQQTNWGVIDFQKSGKSTENEVMFTVNLGVCSLRILDFLSSDLINQKPSIGICHWRDRIGFFLPEHKDMWWTITTEKSFVEVQNELTEIIEKIAIPAIKQHISDKQLVAEWLSDRSPGLTDVDRLINASILLKSLGMHDEFISIKKEMEEKAAEKPAFVKAIHYMHDIEQIKESKNAEVICHSIGCIQNR